METRPRDSLQGGDSDWWSPAETWSPHWAVLTLPFRWDYGIADLLKPTLVEADKENALCQNIRMINKITDSGVFAISLLAYALTTSPWRKANLWNVLHSLFRYRLVTYLFLEQEADESPAWLMGRVPATHLCKHLIMKEQMEGCECNLP